MSNPRPGRLDLIDVLRGLTILWVTALHFYADTRGVPGPEAGAGAAWAALVAGRALDLVSVLARALVAVPGYRLDVLLFITGLVLSLGRPAPAGVFFRRRARSILPIYWTGSLCAAALLVGLAGLRAWLRHTPVAAEIHGGSLLASAPYYFEWGDIVRSISVIGRFENTRTMQVVAPSLWYVVLVAQFYVLFPAMRALLARLGPWRFVAAAWGLTCAGRWLVYRLGPVPGFEVASTLVSFLPFRLASPALGMVAAAYVARLRGPRLHGALLLLVAFGCGLAAAWLGQDINAARNWRGFLGTTLPLAVGLPGVVALAAALARTRVAGATLRWVGMRPLSALVAQDLLRLTVGTMISLGVGLAPLTWILMLPYLLAAVAITRVWHPWQERLTERWWPQSAA
jgi:peptidoglycan/LPS O-acetylase OafA/YrhL